jgi:ribonuclease P protein component
VTTALGRDTVASARPGLWRVTDRTAFMAIRRAGRRARRGPLTVTWLPPTPGAAVEPPRVAFAIGRAVGGAVVRNRIRRRLRAGLRELQVTHGLPHGSYLLSGGPELARLPWPDLCSVLADAVHAATDRPTGDAR